MSSLRPTTGVIGLPTGVKEAGRRVDFRPDDFTLAIETKGYRIAWARAALCPCVNNLQTDQADPTCALCTGSGWFYFKPTDAVADAVGDLTELQTTLLARYSASVVRGIMSQFDAKRTPWQVVGNWKEGDTQLTVRPENRLAYYDRIVNLDSEIVYAEQFELAAGDTTTLRYLATGVNLLRSVDTIYEPTVDYEVINGDIVWQSGKHPGVGVRVAAHYLTHPVWLVIEHPHVLRTTLRNYKRATSVTPRGDPEPLPMQSKIRFEFLL